MSDKKVVEAAKKLVTVYADASNRTKIPPAYQKYEVSGIPAILFLDAEGKKVDEAEETDVKGLVAKIEAVVKKYKSAKK